MAQDRGLNVYAGFLNQLPEEWGPFDLITYWDSFMLVDNPSEEMERILNHLHKDGWVCLRLRQHGFQKFFYHCWRIFGNPLHLPNPSVYHPYNFSPGTIRALAGRYNLEAEISTTVYTVGDPYSTLHAEAFVNGIKWISGCSARVIYHLSGGRWIMSPGMDIWLQRRDHQEAPPPHGR